MDFTPRPFTSFKALNLLHFENQTYWHWYHVYFTKCTGRIQIKVLITIPFCSGFLISSFITKVEHFWSMHLLNVGSIRIYILTTGVVSNETNTYVRMYIEEFILVDIWIHWS